MELIQIKRIKKFENNTYNIKTINGVKVKEKKEKITEGTIIRDGYYEHILFKNQNHSLTDLNEIEEYLNLKIL